MYVTREERQPLGGFLTFVLPMMAAGVVAVTALQIFGFPAGTIFGVSFLLLWRGSRPVSSLAAVILVTLLVAGQSYVQQDDFSLPDMSGMISWAILIAFAAAATNDPDAALELPPPYRAVFSSLISLPFILAAIALCIGLFLILITAIYEGVTAVAGDVGMVAGMIIAAGILGLLLGGVVSLVRYQRALIGWARFALLISARYLLPFLCVIALAFFLSSLGNPNYAPETKQGAYLIAATVLLIAVSLVYADGESRSPAIWIRLSVWFALIVLLILVSAQILSYVTGETSNLLPLTVVSLGSLFVLVSVVADLAVRGERWMPLLAPLNTVLLVVIAVMPALSAILTRMT